MTTTYRQAAADNTHADAAPTPLDKPLQAAHPQAPAQPVLVADQLTGAPVWIYPNTPPPPPPPRVDPVAQRILAAGAAAPLLGWGGVMFFGAVAGATTGLGYAAVCAVSYAVIRTGGGKSGSGANVNIRIDNRGH
jgi:hypothetical protein